MEYLAAKNAEDMAAGGPNLPFLLPIWFRQIQIFQDAEAERIIGGDPSAAERHLHKEALAMLIWQGEFLVNRFREKDVPEQAGVTLANVEATLEALYDKQSVFFGGMTNQRRAQVLDEVFGAS